MADLCVVEFSTCAIYASSRAPFHHLSAAEVLDTLEMSCAYRDSRSLLEEIRSRRLCWAEHLLPCSGDQYLYVTQYVIAEYFLH